MGAGIALFASYAATSAPGNTVWDSGEFVSAAASWGIPHPPGTPLYVTIARAWMLLLGMLPTARAVNLLSAAATAAAAGCLAWWVARVSDRGTMGLAAGLCAGAFTTAWSNATETEAYATALLLAMGMLLAADRAGRTGDRGALALTAYFMALAVPMHLSALVAAPAAIVLAAPDAEGGWRRADAALLAAVMVIAAGVGRASAPITLVGAAGLAAAVALSPRGARLTAAFAACMVPLALSALAIMKFRAMHDPAINTYAPVTWQGVWEVTGRRAFGAFAMWPRNAPLWLQFTQFLEYVDWQPALGLAPTAMPSVARTSVTVIFLVLGVLGAAEHRRLDARSWRALAVLFVGASVGLVLYLNFYPGFSLGYGIVPDSVRHEVRERDYFFVLAFWTWGAWAGIGAVALASRFRTAYAPVGVLVAALPIALNWGPMDRARGPDRNASPILARAILWGTPQRAILLGQGDEDTFSLWEATIVEHQRRDVTVMPWAYVWTDFGRAQLAHRDSLLVDTIPDPMHSLLVAARARGRPVALAFSPDTTALGLFGGRWMVRGLTFVPADSSAVRTAADVPLVDTLAARDFVKEFGVPEAPGEGIDWAPRHALRIVGCPAGWLALARGQTPEEKLDSRCKLK